MKFRLNVDMDNAAFEAPHAAGELARILEIVALHVLVRESGTVRDINGNTVGTWVIR